MDENETLEELGAKLSAYREQYVQVCESLELQPDEADLIQLKSDLKQIVDLTQQLYEVKELEEQAQPPPPPTETTTTEPAQTITTALTTPTNSASSPFPTGTSCQARWSQDQKWYKAIVTAVTVVDGVLRHDVTFTEYGNTEVVTLDALRNPPSEAKVRVVRPTEARELAIPDALKVKATDSEEEKERKRKKVKRIKSKNRMAKFEATKNKKQATWQSFIGGKGAKKMRGLKKKGSIFASPDTVEGKVGVVGSGQTMTKFREKRPKYGKDGSLHENTSIT
eukprot:TRINITY_DN10653_c0_g1_i1.p1 TRINITY_DN10653_c0_g1~~TRINITY_DN10653_c0_g1_i1.p1  ORF type:complete len:280 (+),score=70.55 TRINITY_DN10653_c0_g1_i1:130-969(+)